MIKNYSVSNLENRKALLVYPEFPIDSFWNYRLLYEKIFPKNQYGFPKSGFPPLGLLCIANVISAAYGRKNVRLIDMNVQSLTDADYAWGDDVYLSAMLTQARSFDAVAEKAKALGKTRPSDRRQPQAYSLRRSRSEGEGRGAAPPRERR